MRGRLAPLERSSNKSTALNDDSELGANRFKSPQLTPIGRNSTQDGDEKFKSPQLTTNFNNNSESPQLFHTRRIGGSDDEEDEPLVDKRFQEKESKGKEAIKGSENRKLQFDGENDNKNKPLEVADLAPKGILRRGFKELNESDDALVNYDSSIGDRDSVHSDPKDSSRVRERGIENDERHRSRDTERERDKERDRERDMEREREIDREIERERKREIDRDRNRDRERERDRDRDRDRNRDSERGGYISRDEDMNYRDRDMDRRERDVDNSYRDRDGERDRDRDLDRARRRDNVNRARREVNRDIEIRHDDRVAERDGDMDRDQEEERDRELQKSTSGGRRRLPPLDNTREPKAEITEQEKRINAIKARARERLREGRESDSESASGREKNELSRSNSRLSERRRRDNNNNYNNNNNSEYNNNEDREIEREKESDGGSYNGEAVAGPSSPQEDYGDDDIDIKAIIAIGEKIRENMKAGANIEEVVDEEAYLISSPADSRTRTEWANMENQTYTYAPSAPVSLLGENGQPFEPRYLEEEGLFVGDKPAVSHWNSNRLEQRLLREDNTGMVWFGVDGRMANEADPLKAVSERLTRWFDPSGGFSRFVFVPPSLSSSSSSSSQQLLLPVSDQFFHLELDIIDIHFYDHPLFSEEDLMASQLRLLYNQFMDRSKLDLWNFYTNKLHGLQENYKKVKSTSALPAGLTSTPSKDFRKFQSLRRSSNWRMSGPIETPNEMDNETRAAKLNELRERIKVTRDTRISEAQTDVLMIQKLVAIWSRVKRIREVQGFSNTTIKFILKQVAINPEEEAAREREEIIQELEEREDDHAARFAEAMEAYDEKLNAWRETYRRTRLTASGGVGKQSVGEDGEPEKPEWVPFDKSAEENAIVQRYEYLRENYGLPAPVPVLSDVTPSPAADCTPQEQQRRKDIIKLSMYARVCANGQIVTRTRSHPLDSSFKVDIKEAFSLRLAKWPNKVSIQIFVSGQMQYPLSNSMLGEVSIDVPVRETSKGDVQLAEFTTEKNFAPMWDLHANAQLHYTSGAVRLVASWVSTSDNVPAVPPIPPQVLRSIKQQEKKESTNTRTKEWVGAPVDPNDPRNTNVIHLMRRNVVDLRDGLAFSTEPHELLLLEGYYPGRRHELLKQRNDKVIRPSLIPLDEKEINDEDFPLIGKEEQLKALVPSDSEKTLFLAAKGLQLRSMKRKLAMMRLDEEKERGPRVQDVVILPTVSQTDFGELFKDLFRPRRKLNPQRKERQIVVVVPDTFNLVVQVNRAFNIPIPRTPLPSPANQSQREPEYEDAWKDDEPLHTYVEVRYGDQVQRTRIVPGSNPQWNETVSIPISLPNTKNRAQQIPLNNILVSIVDETVVELEKDDRDKDSIFQRVERRWLGFVEIPFPTVYYSMKVEGHFPVFSPDLQVSYRQPPDATGYLMKTMGVASSRTTLSLYVTLDPPLSHPLDLAEKLQSVEEKIMLQYINYWVRTVKGNANTANRQLCVLVADLNASTGLIVRYIRPQEPPSTLASEESLIRYVSLIPVVPTPPIHGRPPIWSTSQQILDMRGGERIEHAILLCNYFLFLKKEAWVVLGWSIPEGHTAYVMTRAAVNVAPPQQVANTSFLSSFMSMPFFFQSAPPPSYTFINPVSGISYPQHDLLIPLRDIYLIFNNTNIWANIQETGEPFRMHFDLSRAAHWHPFFTNRFPMPPLPSVQTEQLEYDEMTEMQVSDIQSQIEAIIIHTVEKTRARRYPTRWNRVCNRVLREVMGHCEADVLRGRVNEDEHVQAMADFTSSYHIHGFPFHTPFTSLHDVASRVLATNIFNTEEPRAEFSLAVVVHPYPGRISSIWIYAVVLIPKSGNRRG